MSDEWNLSNFVRPADSCVSSEIDMILVDEVKEFIKRLKDGMPSQDITEAEEQEKFINKLAGEKLI